MLPILLLVACSGSNDDVETLKGSLTWSVQFDDTARAAGYSDCSYTRTYDGHTDRSAPWLCPDCDAIIRVASDLDDPSCYGQISGFDPSAWEWLGWSGETFMRASVENLPLSEQGTITNGRRVAYEGEWTDHPEGRFRLDVVGTLRVREGRGDAMWGMEPPESYACGWPKADPRPYDGDWRLQTGTPVPDGWFLDACEEPVRLHDLLGTWIVIGVSALDCGPCQEMAVGEEAFIRDMAKQGIEVQVVTLLAPTLDAVIDPTPTRDLREWESVFELSNPVLADRGWGYALGSSYSPSFGYPTILIVDPKGRLVQVRTGFSSWDSIGAVLGA